MHVSCIAERVEGVEGTGWQLLIFTDKDGDTTDTTRAFPKCRTMYFVAYAPSDLEQLAPHSRQSAPAFAGALLSRPDRVVAQKVCRSPCSTKLDRASGDNLTKVLYIMDAQTPERSMRSLGSACVYREEHHLTVALIPSATPGITTARLSSALIPYKLLFQTDSCSPCPGFPRHCQLSTSYPNHLGCHRLAAYPLLRLAKSYPCPT